MAKFRRFLLSLAAPLAASLGGCDSASEQAAQETPAIGRSSEGAMLVGEPDPIFAGETIPAAGLIDPQGNELALNDLDEPVLINLWATWCAPCVTEMPLLDQLAQDYQGRLQVITINEDGRSPEVVTRFFAEHALPNLPQWIDAENAVAAHFGGGPGLPLSVLYDAEGRELWRVVGDYAWDSEEARAAIDAALAENSE